MRKNPLAIIVLVLCLPFLSIAKNSEIITAEVQFYSASFTLPYDPAMDFSFTVCARRKCMKEFYQKMESTNFDIMLDALLWQKERLQLNDWFFYRMLKNSVDQVFQAKTAEYRTMVCWFLLTKAGYETNLLTAVNKYIFLAVATADNFYHIPYTRHHNKKYINLTAVYQGLDTRRALYEVPNYQPEKNGKLFSLKIEHLPNLPAAVVQKTIRFPYDNELVEIPVEVDTLVMTLMQNYPVLDDQEYFKVPLSKTLRASLIPQLKALLEGKTAEEKVQFLVSLTRRSFQYKWDYNLYNRNQPVIADELFVRKYSDHGDRCVLFYSLMKELTDLDLLVINYCEDYLTVAVALPEKVGKPIYYQDKTYYVCDPTGPNNSKKIGKFPAGMKKETAIVFDKL